MSTINTSAIELDRRKERYDHECFRLMIERLKIELSKDKSEGSYYHSWQSNIAMAFYDEFLEHREKVKRENMKPKDIHEIANNAAKRFLDQLIAS